MLGKETHVYSAAYRDDEFDAIADSATTSFSIPLTSFCALRTRRFKKAGSWASG
jgi:hypothetical protein